MNRPRPFARLSATAALCALCLGLPASAWAQGGLLDIDVGDFDLGDDTKSGETSMTYEGQVQQDAANYKAGTPVKITHTKGNISVRCTDSQGLQARINFTVEGTKQDTMKRYGDSIGVRTYASNYSATVSTSVQGKWSGISDVQVPLTVNLPKEAKVSITGSQGWVSVSGCTGTIKASTKNGGIYVDGVMSQFTLSSGEGDIEIDLADEAEITATSKATATNGEIILRIPLTQSANFSARGTEVQVEHLVSGTNTASHVQGTMGNGGPSISLSANKGTIKIEAPK